MSTTCTGSSSFDLDGHFAWMKAQRKREQKQLDAERWGLLRLLHLAGVTKLEASYDAYGDSGNIEDIVPDRKGLTFSHATDTSLRDFLWGFVAHIHPGFEINEGASGEIRWDILRDLIEIQHGERYIEVIHTSHEGL